MSLHKFTHISLLKNDTQLKQKSDRPTPPPKKKQLTNYVLIKKNKKVIHLFGKKIVYVQMNEGKKRKSKQSNWTKWRRKEKKKLNKATG